MGIQSFSPLTLMMVEKQQNTDVHVEQYVQRPQNPEDYEEEGAPTLRVNPPAVNNSSTLLIIGCCSHQSHLTTISWSLLKSPHTTQPLSTNSYSKSPWSNHLLSKTRPLFSLYVTSGIIIIICIVIMNLTLFVIGCHCRHGHPNHRQQLIQASHQQ